MSNSTMMRYIATDFRKRFGGDSVKVDEFDAFIIDHKLADDPNTDDTKDQRHTGFVQQRFQARNRINTAAAKLGQSESFVIVVDKKKKSQYIIRDWAEDQKVQMGSCGDYIRTAATGRLQDTDRRANRLAKALQENPGDERLQHFNNMGRMLQANTGTMVSKVVALVQHWEKAVLTYEKEAERLIKEYADVMDSVDEEDIAPMTGIEHMPVGGDDGAAA